MASLSRLLTPKRVVEVEAGEAAGALRSLCEAASQPPGRLEVEHLLAAVLEREALSSTGFGDGLAMPHVRLAEAEQFVVALGRSRAGVPFGALDGRPVHLFMLVVGPEGERERYQKLMSRAARFLKRTGSRLIDCEDLAAAARDAAVDF